jgi:hypothetical protein
MAGAGPDRGGAVAGRVRPLSIVGQTERRVFQGETVAAREKIVSLFEPHTDIILKGGRDVECNRPGAAALFTRGAVAKSVTLELVLRSRRDGCEGSRGRAAAAVE